MPMSVYLILFGLLLDVTSAADDPKLPTPDSMITVEKITPEAYKSFIGSGQLPLIKQDSGLYRPYVPPVTPGGSPCLMAFSKWFSQNSFYYQSAANKQCMPYRGAWGNDGCCVLFVVNPQTPPCGVWLQYEYVQQLSVPAFAGSGGTSGRK
ncbi:unnamed protein product [Adineta steineri]|uniref:Uncharacterized protein n=1 Tax=Adineta steineri TaxID=433720 RepID=A0A815RDI0_9BILA|nr:unnamed protein product [Adineta steineri]CAF1474442.1 unnamed protein product [Adineta steineri]CAF3589747.1 unnamed protein product [Adineta steineri]CAF3940924.1 unnamed protein product [Adineta steineri]